MGTMQKCLLLLFGFLIAKASGQDKSFLTWNTEGATWATVVNFLGHYDVLAIQECGSLSNFPYRLVIDSPYNFLVGIDNNQIREDAGHADVQSYMFTVNRQTYYLYYFDHRVNTATGVNVNGNSPQYNMAIISNERANTVYTIPTDSSGPRVFINRHIMGIRVTNYMIFTTHTDPKHARAEINNDISKVSRYLAQECHQTKWILMGDFNVLPGQVQLPADTQYCFHQKVFPALATRPSSGRIIDFGVYGGPINWRNSLQANTLINVIGSDHFPVEILPINTNFLG